MFVIVILFGAFCLYLGIVSLRRSHAILTRGQRVEATVVAIEETVLSSTQGGMRSKGYHAIYSYKDYDGNEHRLPGRTKSTNRDNYIVGASKMVVYDPEAPTDVVDAGVGTYLGGAFYIAFAMATIALGVLGLINDW